MLFDIKDMYVIVIFEVPEVPVSFKIPKYLFMHNSDMSAQNKFLSIAAYLLT